MPPPVGLGWQDVATVARYDHLVVAGAQVGPRRHGGHLLARPILRSDRAAVEATVRGWIHDPDPRRRRTSIILQHSAGGDTDTILLADVIIASADDPFFLRTGVGWALREDATTDPSRVRSFVAVHGSRLSPRSRREALEHLG